MIRTATCFLSACLALGAASADAALIAYWDQNSNGIPSTTLFGFLPSAFPQAASQGAGTLSLANFDATTKTSPPANIAEVGYLDFIESFGGNVLNAQPSIVAGGSISPEGGAADGGQFSNNGMSIILQVNTTLYEDIKVSWAQRGTSSGFQSREFLYSTDGVNYTSFATDTGVLTATWVLESYDLSAIAAVENVPAAYFAIRLSGATGSTGNNRFDNLTVEGTLIPEPSTAVIALLGLAAGGAVTMRARLG
jgi:hypothetical protein